MNCLSFSFHYASVANSSYFIIALFVGSYDSLAGVDVESYGISIFNSNRLSVYLGINNLTVFLSLEFNFHLVANFYDLGISFLGRYIRFNRNCAWAIAFGVNG